MCISNMNKTYKSEKKIYVAKQERFRFHEAWKENIKLLKVVNWCICKKKKEILGNIAITIVKTEVEKKIIVMILNEIPQKFTSKVYKP